MPRALPGHLRGANPLRFGDTPVVFLTAAEAATLLRVSLVTLGRWRIEGCGPRFRKFGRRVVYLRDDLISWADAQGRASTSDPGRQLRSASWYRK